MILDSKQTYLDADGNRLAGGRLRFFVWGTTTPATVFADPAHLIPVPGSVALTSAGWAPYELHSDEDLDVRSDKFLGLDEFGIESYQEVKAFRYIPAGIASPDSTVSMAVVETVADLRTLSTTFASAMVLGYYEKGDCPTRVFTSSAATAIPNGGTTVNSTANPTLQWEYTPGGDVDCRTFGVISSPATTVNSQLAACLGYCDSAHKNMLVPAGTYRLTSGSLATAAAVHASAGASFTSSATYTLTLYNPASNLRTGFAGAGLRLVISGPGWETGEPIPMSAFNAAAGGHDAGTASYNLLLDNGPTPYAFARTALNNVIVGEGLHHISCTALGSTCNDLSGPGQVSFDSLYAFGAKTLRTSCLAGGIRAALVACTGRVEIDSPVTLTAGTRVSAYVEALSGGSLTAEPSCAITGGYGGLPNFILGKNGLDVGFSSIQQDFFADADGLVNSWNASLGAAGELEMGRQSSTATLTRSGTIRNGTVGVIAAEDCVLHSVSVVGAVIAKRITAYDSTIALLGANNMQRTNLTNCSLTGSQSYFDATHGTWTNVASNSPIRTYGDSNLRECSAPHLYLSVGGSGVLASVSVEGGTITGGIYFDAANGEYSGACQAHQVSIRNVSGLANNINSVNGATKKWADAGHTKVDVYNNFGSRGTKVSAKAPASFSTGDARMSTYAIATASQILHLGPGYTAYAFWRSYPVLALSSTIEASPKPEGFGYSASEATTRVSYASWAGGSLHGARPDIGDAPVIAYHVEVYL